MKVIAILALCTATAGCANSLDGTSWLQVDPPAPNCPDRLAFADSRYSYYNTCHAARSDGLVESGRYSFAQDQLVFSQREMHALPYLTGTYMGEVSFWGTAIRQDQLVLQSGPSTQRRFVQGAVR